MVISHDVVRHVRDLDVAWAMADAARRGMPFVDGFSAVSWEAQSAAEIALATLHRLRIKIGTKRQSRESRDWLVKRGLVGHFWLGDDLSNN